MSELLLEGEKKKKKGDKNVCNACTDVQDFNETRI